MRPDLFRTSELAHRYFTVLGWEKLRYEPWTYRSPDGRVCRLNLDEGTGIVQAAYGDMSASFDAAVGYAATTALPAGGLSDIMPSRRRAHRLGWLRRLLSVARIVAIR
ncbi:hypothetical protein HL658_23630 [Azospirillum sp. RWY-5-1]|uniref:Uncharacterized protein n=1 Tax=Azospirillum oleiclasticum TaxID=2735135 RepID=A0ABX2TIT6_9PROT|nr:hypothetical protein [Azospirillum oleiclasticum]NYZ15542.1 hypothetical protein [Azospirillum oleiclasticum]NYZ22565.1 hypothetical protein [Azospirillum oleiclasticum]